MIFGSLKTNFKDARAEDGELILIHGDRKRAVRTSSLAKTFLQLLENWETLTPKLRDLNERLQKGVAPGIFTIDEADLAPALPRTFLFADGSAFIEHIKLVRKSRNAELPKTLLTVPLMYQAECGRFLSPREPIPFRDEKEGVDFEAEVGVITDFVPAGISANEALTKILCFVLINDVSLRGLIPEDLASGFGFFVSKPNSSLSPFALTPDELGHLWSEGRVKLPLRVELNGELFGCADAGAMHFHFGELIAYAARTRDLQAGTIIGSGTVSNEDEKVGASCLAEKRTRELIATGAIKTPFLKPKDHVRIWMENDEGLDLFGTIDQVVASKT